MPLSRLAVGLLLVGIIHAGGAAPAAGEVPPMPLFQEWESPLEASPAVREGAAGGGASPGILRSRSVRVSREVVRPEGPAALAIDLFDGTRITARRERAFRNRSGSTSWVGRVEGDAGGRVVMVTRDGVTVASIRAGRAVYMLYPEPLGFENESAARTASNGERLHSLQQIHLAAPFAEEAPPTEIYFSAGEQAEARALASRMQAGDAAQDDGSVQDLLVVYTPGARDEVGGTTAIENLIDLGVTETNLSYEASGIHHRLRLAHAELIDYDEFSPGEYGPRDRLQIPDDGHMDEVHPLRDQHRADLVKLVMRNGGGCGRAFIMAEVSLAFEAYAFAATNWVCISPYYTFQHELGHLQGGRHQWGGDSTDNAPFTFNHGYITYEHEFRTIMAGAESSTCPDCDRRLAWANPDVLDPVTGAPMGVPEGQPMACDNRKTLNATAWTVANFRVNDTELFRDGFESGDVGAWAASRCLDSPW